MGLIKTLKRRIIPLQNLFSKNLQLNNKNIIITGANYGIALALVKNLNIHNNILAFVNKDKSNISDTTINYREMCENPTLRKILQMI